MQWSTGVLCQGFRKVLRLSKCAHYLKFLDERPQEVQDYIEKELQVGRIEDPLLQPPFPKYQMSPVGGVPKKALGEFKIIHNLSYLCEL